MNPKRTRLPLVPGGLPFSWRNAGQRPVVLFLAGLLRTREMPEYRACLVSEDGSVLRSVLLVCPDDEVAKEYARQLVDGHAIELWQGERRVGKFIAGEGKSPR
jgi:hypothetical protein